MLTTEKTSELMSEMMGKHFFGEPKNNTDPKKKCKIFNIIKNRINLLESELNEAKIKFADASLVKDNWSCVKEREVDCKVLEGQIAILSKIQYDFEDMLAQSPD